MGELVGRSVGVCVGKSGTVGVAQAAAIHAIICVLPKLTRVPLNDDGTVRNSAKMAATYVPPSKPACAASSILFRLANCRCEASSGWPVC